MSVNLTPSQAQGCLENKGISPSNSVNLTSSRAQECLENNDFSFDVCEFGLVSGPGVLGKPWDFTFEL